MSPDPNHSSSDEPYPKCLCDAAEQLNADLLFDEDEII